MKKHMVMIALAAAALLSAPPVMLRAADGPKPLKVFVLAGQSNMEGQGVIKMDPARNEGKGTLEFLVKDPTTRDRFKHLVDAKGAWVDRAMGTLRGALRKLGIADDTMVWFCSDNGSWLDPAAPTAHGSNGPFRGRKGDVWEDGIRVPGLIEWPARIKRPFVTDVPVCTSDIYPTLVDLLKIAVPDQVNPLDDISLVPLLDGQMKERPSPIGFWARGGGLAWNDNRYKLIQSTSKEWELYDIVADPSEKDNLAAKHPEILSRMKAEFENWQQSVQKSDRGEDYPAKS
jgi:arylsulfatase A-like enzyme